VSATTNLSRRGFLQAGGGLVLGLHLSGFGRIPELDDFLTAGADSTAPGTSLNAWIRIAKDGTATLRVGAVEMGQGVFTALPMILAEELDLPFSAVRVEAAPVHKSYHRPSPSFPGKVMMTGGSESVRGYWDVLRRAGSEARAMLVATAAQRWGVAPKDCRTAEGAVLCGDLKADYGELTEDAAQRKPPRGVRPKEREDCTLLETSPPRVDLPDKVCGKAIFGIDVVVEGMVNATLRACPHHGGSLESFDDRAARAVAGVIDIFPIDEAVVVVADTFWHAKKAASLLDITWNRGPAAGLDDKQIRATLEEALAGAPIVHRHGGRPQGLDIEASYFCPYLEHAPLEPLNATVHVQDDRVDVWAPTQVQQAVQDQASEITGLRKSRCFVHSTYLGGGFGRKSLKDFTGQAIQIGLRVRKPVKMIWTREETFSHGQYRPATACRMRARLDADGFPTDYEAAIASQNIIEGRMPSLLLDLPPITHTVHGGLGDTPYAIDRQAVRYQRVSLPIPVGWWRSVHGSHNGFYRESFIDELAHAGGHDPIAYRRHLLREDPRHLACFELALEGAGSVAAGQHRGVAIFASFGSIVATVLDLTVEAGWPSVKRVTTAVDCGRIVHPDTIRAQMMGATIMGLSAALYEQVHFRDGATVEQNFHQYRVLGMSEAPTVDTHIVDSDEAPGGVGEVALPPLAGALANAIFAATGKRIRTLPLGDQLKA
jgi:isoquinoline 1-oxidoreductase beta subunit